MVAGRVRVGSGDDVDPLDDSGDLLAGCAGEGEGLGDERLQFRQRQAEPAVIGQPLEQVVLGRYLLAQGEGHADRMLLDDLVRRLAPDTVADRRHEDLGGGKEGKVAIKLAVDHSWEGTEVVEHRQKRLEESIDGEERVG